MELEALKQTIRDAIESEYAGVRFFRGLAQKDVSPAVREFFLELAAQEEEQARRIEQFGDSLVPGIALRPQPGVSWSHTAPEWEAVDTINARQALEVAQECEYAASLYYDALADWCPDAAHFFRELARTEERHARGLRALMSHALEQVEALSA